MTRPQRRFLPFLATVAAVGLLAGACAKPKLASIEVTPNATVPVNGTQQFTAVGRDTKGNIFDITPSWAVVADGGTITESGLFTAGNAPGHYVQTVQASSDGISGTATVVVTPPPTPEPAPLASIEIERVESENLEAGATRRYVAVGKDSAGNVVAITPTWSVVSGGGTIDSTGLFTAGDSIGAFPNTIRVSSGNIEALTSVTVTSAAPSAESQTTMGEELHFGFDQSNITAESRTALDAKVKVLEDNPEMRISIVGHTDAIGSDEYNLALGTRRAEAAKAYLVSAGVDASRIDTDSKGESEPMAEGTSDEARAQNRRSTFEILPAAVGAARN